MRRIWAHGVGRTLKQILLLVQGILFSSRSYLAAEEKKRVAEALLPHDSNNIWLIRGFTVYGVQGFGPQPNTHNAQIRLALCRAYVNQGWGANLG